MTAAIGLALCLLGAFGSCEGCCSGPSLERAKQWVNAEVPRGSSELDVKRFCQKHDFNYSQGNEREAWARLERRCLLFIPEDIVARFLYDDVGQVRSTEVSADNLFP